MGASNCLILLFLLYNFNSHVLGQQRPSFDNSLAKICKKVSMPTDILFIIDGSGSVGGPNFETQIAMLNKIVDLVKIGPNDTQLGVMQYSSYTYIEFGFSAYSAKDKLRAVIGNLQHRSGTTKTGKALDKALQMFTNRQWGSRFGKTGVQQIVVVVSDGHSRDDPAPAASRLRQAGVRVIALGIGQHINMKELVDMTNDSQYAFENLTQQSTMERFAEVLKQATITDECEYLRGPEGAQITCQPDAFQVGVTMEKEFGGVLFVDGHFDDPACRLQANSTDFELRVGLLNCGIKRQFLINPRGFAFAATVVLQFHPEFSTALDRRFNVHCFYQDRNEADELDWQLIKEHTQRKNKDNNKLPCEYSIEPVGKQPEAGCDKNFYIGDQVIHKWNCSAEHFDAYQSMAGFAVKISPLSWNAAPPLVTFGKQEKQKTISKRRRPELDQTVGALVITRNETYKAPPQSVDLKLSTQDVKIVDINSTRDSVLPKVEFKNVAEKLTSRPKPIKLPVEKSIEVGSDTNKSADDPFQNEWRQISSGVEDTSDLNESVLSKLTTDQILIESEIFNVQNSQNPTCRFGRT
ncbi:Cuticlin-1 [Aphelenchoides bicaudatus]|nr:Cuticlin-1 [Aphelenchoides bicaudatus]